ncbi:hypothetical protein [Streptomyces sp. bgisy126]
MNDSLSLAADILTIVGVLVSIVREARREANEARQGKEPPTE